MYLRHSIPNRHALRTRADGVRGILDVCTSNHFAAGEQDGAADAEIRVGTWIYLLLG